MEAVHDTVDAVTAAPPERQGVGAMLRARRIELSMTQGDVANVIKLPTSRIEALEQERWEELPSGPYLRGFLRNIARALHIDAAMLMERVGASLVQSRSPDSILVAPGTMQGGTLPRRSGPADDRRGGRSLVFGACAFALIAALIAWSGTGSFDRAMAAARSMLGSSGGVASVISTPMPTGAAAVPVNAAGQVSEPIASPAPASDAAAAATPPATANVALTFHFNEDSWVEVRSADGKVLLQRLNIAGSEQRIDGEAPFSVIVGNAKGVDLRFRGQPVDLGPYTRDQVARFTLS